jgi:hypothetical protein
VTIVLAVARSSTRLRQRFQTSTPAFRARYITTQSASIDAAPLSHYPSNHVWHESGLRACSRPECAGAESSACPCAPDILLPLPYSTGSSSSPGARVPDQRPANRARHVARRVDLPFSTSPRWHCHPHMAAPAHGHHVRLRRNGVG